MVGYDRTPLLTTTVLALGHHEAMGTYTYNTRISRKGRDKTNNSIPVA